MGSRMNRSAMLSCALAIGILAVASAAAGATREIASGGTTTIRPGTTGTDQIQFPEFQVVEESDDGSGAGSFNRPRPGRKNGKLPHQNLDTPAVASSLVAASNPQLALSFLGLNHRDQRLANGGQP